MRVFVLLLCLFFLSGEATASDDPFQKAFLYLGKVPHGRGIRLLPSQEVLAEKKGGRWCQRTYKTQPRTISLDVEDVFFQGNPPRVEVEVDYFDEGEDTFVTLARTAEGDYRVGRILKKENSRTWRTYRASLHFPQFGPRENAATHPDLVINNRWDGDEFIRMVRVRIPYLHPETDRLGNLFEPGEPAKLRIKLFKRGQPTTWSLFWNVRDWHGKTVHSGEGLLKVKTGFSTAEEIALPPLPLGAYQATFLLRKGDALLEETVLHFGIAPPILSKTDPMTSPFGVCTELITPFAKKKAELLRGSGILWLRQPIRGDEIYASGKPDWESLDQAVESARKEHLHISGMLLGAPPGTGDFSSRQSRRSFANYSAEVARRYPDIRYWEIWNEPDTIGFWGDRDWKRYLALMKEVYPALKRANPSCQVMNGGIVVGNYWYLGELYQEGIKGFLDAVAIHPYADDPEAGEWNLGMRIDAARSVISKNDPGRKLWLTEIGWNTSTAGISLERQAVLLIRMMVVALSYPEVERVLWFNFDDFGEDPTSDVQNAGIVFKDLSPKPALIAYRNLIRHLTGKRFVGKENVGEGISAYRFADRQEMVLVAWSLKGERPLSFEREEGIQIVDTMGNPLILQTSKEVRVVVDQDPLFVLGPASFSFKPIPTAEMPNRGRSNGTF